MKIAVVVSELNIRGGTHKQVLRLCQYLREKGNDVCIYTKYYDLSKTYSEFINFNIKYLHKEPKERQGILRKINALLNFLILDYLREKKLYKMIPKDVDVINVHDNGLYYLSSLAKKDNKKVVWQINDLSGVFSVGIGKENNLNIFDKCTKKYIERVSKKIDKITVNVTKNKERVKACLNRDALVLYCGVDDNKHLIIHNYNEDNKVFKLLTTGVFLPYRNYETLVDVVDVLRKRGYDVKMDIIGATYLCPEYVNYIETKIQEKNLQKMVKIWGQVDDVTYNKLYNEANAFAFINIDQSWGLTVFEAMSCGLPTIVSNSVGAIELLKNDVDSIIVQPHDINKICDVLINLMMNKEYYNRIAENAIISAKSYTWEKMYCEPLLKVFTELLME